ncbi:hypothetical protein W03_10990 [Nitrosomonas sp. PY1]|uniref:DUF4124 domain-containing protein n=1 Tax=Nitrosomonas sp. PY1 TaxID=1803906 RepID=UPI001FC7F39C|nr:DUF4124 domain-containing protein [Nitrosomonas sp. PY1]GKS69095.1 hypothetical protein W03_10990 [Nitrosomonas sp. PY1]
MRIIDLSVIFVTTLLGFASIAVAGKEIYKLVDKDGNVTFTNRPARHAQKVNLASFSGSANTHTANTLVQKPVNAPSTIKNNAQKERDGTRRQILEKELHTENKLLSDTKQSLSQISQSDDNLQDGKIAQLKSKLFLHQRNISALKKELSRL